MYSRPACDFNPTIHGRSITQLISQSYNFERAVELKILNPSTLTSSKRKFIIYNADLTIRNIRFYEASFEDATENALFFAYFSPFKWLTVQDCIFELR